MWRDRVGVIGRYRAPDCTVTNICVGGKSAPAVAGVRGRGLVKQGIEWLAHYDPHMNMTGGQPPAGGRRVRVGRGPRVRSDFGSMAESDRVMNPPKPGNVQFGDNWAENAYNAYLYYQGLQGIGDPSYGGPGEGWEGGSGYRLEL